MSLVAMTTKMKLSQLKIKCEELFIVSKVLSSIIKCLAHHRGFGYLSWIQTEITTVYDYLIMTSKSKR
ncbi:CLUMA_CG013072, isoform A [Clunio marinus]|uniref:CLUMA_CG013072, isoform A n=1 Tax=Clunio marinus TaxID=568069 RepID=A0A1J1IIU4_9DIPT|nr:CLUMA_CG013072, isoform A [Clunio marinus]